MWKLDIQMYFGYVWLNVQLPLWSTTNIYMFVHIYLYIHMIHIYTLCIFIYTYTCACMISHIWLFIPWTVAHQAPLSMEVSRQEYRSGLPFPSPGDFLDSGIEVMSLASPALAGGFFTTEPPGKSTYTCNSSLLVYMFIYIYASLVAQQ